MLPYYYGNNTCMAVLSLYYTVTVINVSVYMALKFIEMVASGR